MLLGRSVILQVTLLITASLVRSQSYESDYKSYENNDEPSSYSHDEGPDYSEYYSVLPASSPSAHLTNENSFIDSADFSKFLTNFDFGSASNKKETQASVNPFAYENENSAPNYISYNLALNSDKLEKKNDPAEEDINSRFGSEVYDLDKPAQLIQNNEFDKTFSNEDSSNLDGVVNKFINNYDPAAPLKLPELDPKTFANPSGKSSNQVSLGAYNSKYTNTPVPKTPYEKYSFQPTHQESYKTQPSFGTLKSTVAPFNPNYNKILSTAEPYYDAQASDRLSENLKGSNCQRINKHISEDDIISGRFRRQAMNCFSCKDPSTGNNYEQCSYTSDPNPKSYFSGKAEKYSGSTDSDNFRYKRSNEKKDEEYQNPYDELKSRSHKYNSKPDEFEEYYYKPHHDFKIDEDEYRFGQDFFTDDKVEEKSQSEVESQKLLKDGESCRKVKKEGSLCVVCINSKTGGNYEQCSYTSEPSETKYAYVRNRKFDGDGKPVEDKIIGTVDPELFENGRLKEREEITETPVSSGKESELPNREISETQAFSATKKPDDIQKFSNYQHRHYKIHELGNHDKNHAPLKAPKQSASHSYSDPHSSAETVVKEHTGGLGLLPELYGSDDSQEHVENQEENPKKLPYSIDEYHFKFFPEFNNEESKNHESKVDPQNYKSPYFNEESKNHESKVDPQSYKNPYFNEEQNKKEVEDVLAEFVKKDRSACKKIEKNGMTCYLCTDKEGTEHEECMYVSESRPKKSHIAYHGVKHFKDKPTKSEEIRSESQINPTKVEANNQEVEQETTTYSVDMQASASEEIETREKLKATTPLTADIPKTIKRVYRRTKNISNRHKPRYSETRSKRDSQEESDEPTIKTPIEFEVADEDGAYSAETRPVYNKVLGLTLPAYMLGKSQYEDDFDRDSKFTK